MNDDKPKDDKAKPVASSAAPPLSPPFVPANPAMMTVLEAATYLRLSKPTLDRYRCSGGGPEFYKVGPRRVYYHRDDLDAWLARRRYAWTRDYGERNPDSRKPTM